MRLETDEWGLFTLSASLLDTDREELFFILDAGFVGVAFLGRPCFSDGIGTATMSWPFTVHGVDQRGGRSHLVVVAHLDQRLLPLRGLLLRLSDDCMAVIAVVLSVGLCRCNILAELP